MRNVQIGTRDPRHYIEQELGNKTRKIYLIIYPFEEELWIDLQGLPETATLCALCDATPFMQAKVGKGRKTRTFVNMEWALNEWGGDPQIVEALERRKAMTIENMEKYRNDLKDEKIDG